VQGAEENDAGKQCVAHAPLLSDGHD
jgi:hypothetical protein